MHEYERLSGVYLHTTQQQQQLQLITTTTTVPNIYDTLPNLDNTTQRTSTTDQQQAHTIILFMYAFTSIHMNLHPIITFFFIYKLNWFNKTM